MFIVSKKTNYWHAINPLLRIAFISPPTSDQRRPTLHYWAQLCQKRLIATAFFTWYILRAIQIVHNEQYWSPKVTFGFIISRSVSLAMINGRSTYFLSSTTFISNSVRRRSRELRWLSNLSANRLRTSMKSWSPLSDLDYFFRSQLVSAEPNWSFLQRLFLVIPKCSPKVLTTTCRRTFLRYWLSRSATGLAFAGYPIQIAFSSVF